MICLCEGGKRTTPIVIIGNCKIRCTEPICVANDIGRQSRGRVPGFAQEIAISLVKNFFFCLAEKQTFFSYVHSPHCRSKSLASFNEFERAMVMSILLYSIVCFWFTVKYKKKKKIELIVYAEINFCDNSYTENRWKLRKYLANKRFATIN